MNNITVYREAGVETVQCNMECKHTRKHYVTKEITDTGRTWLCDNGYEKTQQPVYVDKWGNEFKRYVSIDYYANTSYIMEGIHWSARKPSESPLNVIVPEELVEDEVERALKIRDAIRKWLTTTVGEREAVVKALGYKYVRDFDTIDFMTWLKDNDKKDEFVAEVNRRLL